MPRPRVVKKGAFLTAWLEEEYLILLDKIARAEGISRSELLRRIIVEWLESPEVKAKYGLQMVFAEQVASASTARLAPLTEKRLGDLKRALDEVAPVVERTARLLPQRMEWARSLIAMRNEYLRLKERGGWVKVGGDLVPAEQQYRRWMAQHEGDIKMLEQLLEEWKRARAKFFKRVYYPWVKGLRKEVPADVMLELDDRITVLLRRIDEVEPLANELEKLLRPERLQRGAGQGAKR